MREIHIRPVLNGFVITVGCSELVFTNIKDLCEELKKYQKDPAGVERGYLENAINKAIDGAEAPAPRTPRHQGVSHSEQPETSLR